MHLRVQYGGTFDPVHNGHLAVARAARDALAAEVWLMPAHDPPHKSATGASAAQRAAMLALAIADQQGLRLDRRELHRIGPSWTILSLRELRAELGQAAPLALLIGADSFLQLPTWREWRRLPELAHLLIAERPGSALACQALPEPLRALSDGRWARDRRVLHDAPAGHLLRLPLPQMRPESATAIRMAIAGGGVSWRGNVPPSVARYIDECGLYRDAPSTGASL